MYNKYIQNIQNIQNILSLLVGVNVVIFSSIYGLINDNTFYYCHNYILFYNIVDLFIGIFITKFYLKNYEYIIHHIFLLLILNILNKNMDKYYLIFSNILIAETTTIFNYFRIIYKNNIYYSLLFIFYFIILRTLCLYIIFINIYTNILYLFFFIIFLSLHIYWFFYMIKKLYNNINLYYI